MAELFRYYGEWSMDNRPSPLSPLSMILTVYWSKVIQTLIEIDVNCTENN